MDIASFEVFHVGFWRMPWLITRFFGALLVLFSTFLVSWLPESSLEFKDV